MLHGVLFQCLFPVLRVYSDALRKGLSKFRRKEIVLEVEAEVSR